MKHHKYNGYSLKHLTTLNWTYVLMLYCLQSTIFQVKKSLRDFVFSSPSFYIFLAFYTNVRYKVAPYRKKKCSRPNQTEDQYLKGKGLEPLCQQLKTSFLYRTSGLLAIIIRIFGMINYQWKIDIGDNRIANTRFFLQESGL